MKAELRRIIGEAARLTVPIEEIGDNDDLYAHGLSSLATVHLMLGIEDAFNIEIPDHLLNRKLFQSINSLAATVDELAQKRITA